MLTWELALADQHCSHCQGSGARSYYGSAIKRCWCVGRVVFRLCLERFRECEAVSGSFVGTVSWDFLSGNTGGRSYGRSGEDFRADFCIISRGVLTPEDYRLMMARYVEEEPLERCAEISRLTRPNLFHALYRIEQRVGLAFAETQPYGIYPLDEYFAGVMRNQRTEAARIGPVQIPAGHGHCLECDHTWRKRIPRAIPKRCPRCTRPLVPPRVEPVLRLALAA